MKSADMFIVGTGPIAREYGRILKAQGVHFEVIGRGEANKKIFFDEVGIKPYEGDLDRYLQESVIPSKAIVATPIETLAKISYKLLTHGVTKLFVEKPAGLNLSEVQSLHQTMKQNDADIFVAYNRRFFSSTLAAQNLIAEDGGIKSFQFDFTEWAHRINPENYHKRIMENWVFANSSHVIDLAFHLGGMPTALNAVVTGENLWQSGPEIYTGSGITKKNTPFSYHANWGGPGRWSAEFITRERKFIFCPMESLKVMRKGSVAIEEVIIDDSLDKSYKPGYYRQVAAFRKDGQDRNLCHLDEHLTATEFVSKIALGSHPSASIPFHEVRNDVSQ